MRPSWATLPEEGVVVTKPAMPHIVISLSTNVRYRLSRDLWKRSCCLYFQDSIAFLCSESGPKSSISRRMPLGSITLVKGALVARFPEAQHPGIEVVGF